MDEKYVEKYILAAYVMRFSDFMLSGPLVTSIWCRFLGDTNKNWSYNQIENIAFWV